MTPVSLMPPVDYCPSCEGRQAESKAFEIGESRAQRTELQSAGEPSADPSPGAPPAVEATARAGGNEAPQSGSGPVQPLLAPDLAVQALLARPEIGPTGTDEAALRLRGAEAYAAR